MKDEIIKYIGKAKYDYAGQIILCDDGKGGDGALVDLRGWGRIENMFPDKHDALKFHDAVGEFITDAINEKCGKADLTERLVALIDDYRARRADIQLTDECLSDLRAAIEKTLSE